MVKITILPHSLPHLFLQIGEGDCDNDANCEGRLKCGTNNCFGEGFDLTDDCCYDPFPTTTTTQKPNPETDNPGPGIDCKAMEDAQLIIRNTRIAFGCDIGNPSISLNTCSQISCLDNIAKEIGSCARESEKMDCQSLEKMSAAISTVTEQYCVASTSTTTTSTTTATSTTTTTTTSTTTTTTTSRKDTCLFCGVGFLSRSTHEKKVIFLAVQPVAETALYLPMSVGPTQKAMSDLIGQDTCDLWGNMTWP